MQQEDHKPGHARQNARRTFWRIVTEEAPGALEDLQREVLPNLGALLRAGGVDLSGTINPYDEWLTEDREGFLGKCSSRGLESHYLQAFQDSLSEWSDTWGLWEDWQRDFVFTQLMHWSLFHSRSEDWPVYTRSVRHGLAAPRLAMWDPLDESREEYLERALARLREYCDAVKGPQMRGDREKGIRAVVLHQVVGLTYKEIADRDHTLTEDTISQQRRKAATLLGITRERKNTRGPSVR